MELSLDHVADGRFVLDGIGELRALRSDVAEIVSGTRIWRCQRSMRGFGQVVNAHDTVTGARAARYVPRGFLRGRGIHAGEFRIGHHRWAWDFEQGTVFILRYGEAELGEFEIGPPQQPVLMGLDRALGASPMLVLLCCFVVKLAADAG